MPPRPLPPLALTDANGPPVAPVPLAWFRFDNTNRYHNAGRRRTIARLTTLAEAVFTKPDNPDAPPQELGNGIRLGGSCTGANQGGLLGERLLSRNAAWSISLWFRQPESQGRNSLVYIAGPDDSGRDNSEFDVAFVPPGILEHGRELLFDGPNPQLMPSNGSKRSKGGAYRLSNTSSSRVKMSSGVTCRRTSSTRLPTRARISSKESGFRHGYFVDRLNQRAKERMVAIWRSADCLAIGWVVPFRGGRCR